MFMATSSGSTGVPTVSPFTQEDFDLWQDTEARLFWQAGMRPTDRYVHGLNFALYVGGPDVIGAQPDIALADGLLRVSVPVAERPKCDVILRGLMMHLTQLAGQYPKNIHITYTEV